MNAIGNTPLVELTSLSKATCCRIMVKCEHLNPGGSLYARVALQIIQNAEKNSNFIGKLNLATETNCEVPIAMIAAAKNY